MTSPLLDTYIAVKRGKKWTAVKIVNCEWEEIARWLEDMQRVKRALDEECEWLESKGREACERRWM